MTDMTDLAVAADSYRYDAVVAVADNGTVRAVIGVEILLGWGMEPNPPLPAHLVDIVHPGRLGEVQEMLASATTPAGLRVPGTVRLRHADGRWISMYVEVEAHPGNADIAGSALRFRPLDTADPPPVPDAGQFEVLAEALASGILTADEDGAVNFANPAARELFWRSEHDLLDDGWVEAIHPDDRAAVQAAADRARHRGTAEVSDFRVAVSGLERWLRARFNAIPAPGSERAGWVAMFEDTTAARADVIELAHQATHDSLTGLANRVLLSDRLDGALARARRSGEPLAVYFCDLDRFKEINDRFGHHIGDDVLRIVAGRITDTVRAEDTAARLGGDEFVVIAEDIERANASSLAARLAAAITAPLTIDDDRRDTERQTVRIETVGHTRIDLGVSIGVAWSPTADHDADGILATADAAMYEAKTIELGLVITTVE